MGTFTLSTNLSTASALCTLRFIVEDCTLNLAPYKIVEKSKNKKAVQAVPPENYSKITVLPSSELVCVLELGLFEISLRMNDKDTTNNPKLDVRTMLNGVHLRTCVDSANAVARLLTYIANDGDFVTDDYTTIGSSTSSNIDTGELFSTKTNQPNVPEVSESQQKRINTLMEEAIAESIHKNPARKFFFHVVICLFNKLLPYFQKKNV